MASWPNDFKIEINFLIFHEVSWETVEAILQHFLYLIKIDVVKNNVKTLKSLRQVNGKSLSSAYYGSNDFYIKTLRRMTTLD
jgi:hypothetical protein